MTLDPSGNLSVTGNISNKNITAQGAGDSPFNFTTNNAILNFNIGSTTQSNYSNLIIKSNTGQAQLWKAGSGYSSYGGVSALNIYNSSGNISFHPSGQANILQITSGEIKAIRPIQMSGTTVIDASRNITATGLKATSGFGNKTTINMTSLNANTWYPVTIGQSAAYREKHIIEVGLNSGSTPSWSTHSGGFSLQLEWTTIGSGWGTTPVVRDVIHYTEAWTTGPVAGQIGQLGNSSVEYVYLRGGANYYYRSERSAVPVVRTTTYTTNGQSVSPITTYGNTPWDSSTNTGNPRFSTVHASSSVNAPIFYDYNNTAYYLDPNSTGTSINVAGSIIAGGNVTAYSDRKVKDNIEPITNALDKVQQLNGVTFNRIDLSDKTKRYAGLIAQDIEKVLPEAVDDDVIKRVDYNATIGLLVEAVKELKSEVDNLKTQLAQKEQ
jgi:hypothetical protein